MLFTVYDYTAKKATPVSNINVKTGSFFNRIGSYMQASAVSRSRIHERTILLRFLGIILRALRLKVLNGFLKIIGKGVWLSIRFPSFLLDSVQ